MGVVGEGGEPCGQGPAHAGRRRRTRCVAGSGRGRPRSEPDVSLPPRPPLAAAPPAPPWAVSTGDTPALAAPAGLSLLPSGRESAVPAGGSSSRGGRNTCAPWQAEGAGRGTAVGGRCVTSGMTLPGTLAQGLCRHRGVTHQGESAGSPRKKAAWKAS